MGRLKSSFGPLERTLREWLSGEECLDREQLWPFTEARVVTGDWRWKYNNIRPHRSYGYISPRKFAQRLNQEKSEQGSE
ncbi:MAG: hypothetical protein CMI18_06060 [Opitutaceae bacterium]|nr:hypothetical protein [Opitutaceae bacterium]